MRRALLALLLTFPMYADCPCVPRENMWVVRTCDGFNCAMSSLAVANGDPLTFAMPAGMEDPRWIVLQRVVGGTYTDDGSDPFRVEQFPALDGATARMNAITSDHRPMIVSAPDGALLVLSLRNPMTPRHRSTR